METNPQPEMEISMEAKEASDRIAEDLLPLYVQLPSNSWETRHAEPYEFYHNIQLAINQSTAPLREEIERLKRICEHCGSNRIYFGPPDCPGCGAPNCCQTCCKHQNQITQLEKQVLGLMDTLKQIVTSNCSDNVFNLASKALSSTADFSSHYTKREVLEKCVRSLEAIRQLCHYRYMQDQLHLAKICMDDAQEALTLTNEELKKGQRG